MSRCRVNGGPSSPQIEPRVQAAGEVGEGPGALQLGARASLSPTPVRRAGLGARGCRGLPERPGVGLGSPQCEWPIILPRGWEWGGLFVFPPGKASLGDNHPGRGVEVMINFFKGGQASSENSWSFRPLALFLFPAAWDPVARPWGWG